ncbi:MAG: PAS domain-containing protein [Bacteroidia bacterium]|nr:MAG: PAS domain-containing protein [Bacteroidia bacterium]
MVFSRFIWSILAFVAAIVLTAILLGIYLQKPEFPVTRSMLVVALVRETIAMIIFLTRIRRDLLKLINAMSNDDPTMQFARVGRDPYFSAIHKGFNALIKDFRLVRLDREAEQRFFEETVNHVQFGLVAFNGTGEVKMVNQAFLELFGLKELVLLNDLAPVSGDLPEFFQSFSPGKETLKKMEIKGQSQHLIFLSSGFVLKGEEITLVSVRDISREMDQNELEAWQKLLRVLRHEILNSISPIKLIAGNFSERLQPKGELLALDQLKEDEIEDILTGLETIHRRASGLSVFLDAYTNLYRTPEFKAEQTAILPLLQRISGLFKEQADQQETTLEISCPDPNIQAMLDARMIEQVLINLVKNAMEAVNSQASRLIILSVAKSRKGVQISVEDTGAGIPRDLMESIFMPFFSTKETGTGVGLSFSQHVMRLHQGFIRVSSTPEEGSVFQLVFGNR